jgi:hypothetical protein
MRLLALGILCLLACGRGVPRDCAELEVQYSATVPSAQACDPTAATNPCNAQAYATIATTCSCCFTAVTATGAQALDSIYDQSKSEGCPGPQSVACPAIIRLSQCVADADAGGATAGHCQ